MYKIYYDKNNFYSPLVVLGFPGQGEAAVHVVLKLDVLSNDGNCLVLTLSDKHPCNNIT